MGNIKLILGDILELPTEAIVNPANEYLAPGGGLCGHIFENAGPEFKNWCARLDKISAGQSILTPGFDLKQPYVIHTVAPNFSDYDLPGVIVRLEQAYLSIFAICQNAGIRSVAIPCIGTGIFSIPKRLASTIAVNVIEVETKKKNIDVTICCFDEENYELYLKLLKNDEK